MDYTMNKKRKVYEEEIRKPDTDKRQYRRFELDNGMSVLLISDPDMKDEEQEVGEGQNSRETQGVKSDEGECSESESEDEYSSSADDEEGSLTAEGESESLSSAKKAGAALCVRVGSFSDTEAVAGISHFLEHMLFMGSEEFPDENEYDSFLSKQGGYSNAYTDTESTNYYFDVQPSGLHGALKRFSAFFVNPLCKEDSVEREVEAVESEFVQALQDNDARLTQLRCHTAKGGHVFSKFAWGNRKSLIEIPRANKLDPRKELLRYYKDQYSSERMSLVILGAEELDTLESWVIDMFSSVRSGLGPPPQFKASGYPFEGGCFYKLPMTKEGHALHVLFQLPCLNEHYDAKPDDYISHLIGHEGRGSLLSVLKSKGLVTDISAGVSEEGYDRSTVCYIFTVTFKLTQSGLKFKENAFGIIEYLFAYINLLKREGAKKWIWDEIASASEIKFRFAEEEETEEYVTRIAANMMLYKPEHILQGEYLHERWNPDLIHQLLESCNPFNMRVELQSSSFNVKDFAQREPWFDIPYECSRLPMEHLQSLEKSMVEDELFLPSPNEFMPSDFVLKEQQILEQERELQQEAEKIESSIPRALIVSPYRIVSERCMEFWYKYDRYFRTPRMCILVSFDYRDAFLNAENAVLLKLCARVLEDSLMESTYLAEVAALHSSMYSYQTRLELKVEGFSHKLPLLLNTIVQGILNLDPPMDRFNAMKESVTRALQNSIIKPSRHAAYLRLLALLLDSRTLEELLAQLENASISKCQHFLRKLVKGSYIQGFIHGNVTQLRATSITDEIISSLKDGRPSSVVPTVTRVAVMKPGADFTLEALVQNPAENNNVSEVYYQIGVDNYKCSAALSLLEQMIHEPFYDTLRTKEQLGYSVSCSLRNTCDMLGFCFQVVSSKYSPLHVEERVEKFLDNFEESLTTMTTSLFQQHKKAAVEAKCQQDHHLVEETDRHWEQISSFRYDFLVRHHHVAEIKAIEHDAFLQWYKSHFSVKSDTRKRLKIRVFSGEYKGKFGNSKSCPEKEILDFRNSVDVYEKRMDYSTNL